jgi:Icc-related predicted phosphoesterase
MKLVLLSDTHTFHNRVKVPDGDVLVHAGDMCLSGSVREAQHCLDWLNKQPHEHVVAIAGNHDWAFATQGAFACLSFGRVIYLENSSVNIEGVNFYGSPVQPEFCNWAFNAPRGAAIKKYWDMIPEAGLVDVLITHGPPMGILDQAAPHRDSEHLGCEELALRVIDSAPLLHVFGHIHGSAGSRIVGQTHYVNAAVVNEAYKVVNPPRVISIMPERTVAAE